jgi:hypothetical protein
MCLAIRKGQRCGSPHKAEHDSGKPGIWIGQLLAFFHFSQEDAGRIEQ